MLAAVDTTPTREEFRRFYQENFLAVWRQLRRLRVREADVADLAHEVFVFAYNHFDEIPAHPEGWLARVSFEMVRNYRRKVVRRREHFAPHLIEATLDPKGDDEATTEIVHEALERMPEDQRMLLLRHHVQEEPLHTLAKALGVARSTIQLRLTAAETTFEGWLKTLLGVDPEKGPRTSLFASFALAGFLPGVWESSEVLAKSQLEGWERLSRAIDASKIVAGGPRREPWSPRGSGLGGNVLPVKLTMVFAVAVPSAVLGMLVGHLGADIAFAQTLTTPLHATTTPIAMIADALVKSTQGDGAMAPVEPRPPPVSTAEKPTVPLEVLMLRSMKQAIIHGDDEVALRLLEEHRRRWQTTTHELERQRIVAIAHRIKAENDAKKAAEAAKQKKDKSGS